MWPAKSHCAMILICNWSLACTVWGSIAGPCSAIWWQLPNQSISGPSWSSGFGPCGCPYWCVWHHAGSKDHSWHPIQAGSGGATHWPSRHHSDWIKGHWSCPRWQCLANQSGKEATVFIFKYLKRVTKQKGTPDGVYPSAIINSFLVIRQQYYMGYTLFIPLVYS